MSVSMQSELMDDVQAENVPMEVLVEEKQQKKGTKRKRTVAPKKDETAIDAEVASLVQAIKQDSMGLNHPQDPSKIPYIAEEEQLKVAPKSDKLPKSKVPANTVFEGEMSTDPTIAARQCTICFKVFPSRDKVKRHAASHQTDAQSFCCICNVPIKYKYNLKNHMQKCLQERRESFSEAQLTSLYPDFIAALRKSGKNIDVPMPTFEEYGLPFKMNSRGMVTGYDWNLINRQDLMLPKYNAALLSLTNMKKNTYDEDEFDDDFDDDDLEEVDALKSESASSKP